MAEGESAEGKPNLTPILDMVFQLITFFMLVTNFKNLEVDQDLKLPVVGSAKPVEMKDQDFLVLNVLSTDVNVKGEIRKQAHLKVFGRLEADYTAFLAQEAKRSLDKLRREKSNPKLELEELKDGLPTIIVIRADKETPFAELYKIFEACRKNKFYNYSLMALGQQSGKK
jgi:biopolymer transport protein ExbD